MKPNPAQGLATSQPLPKPSTNGAARSKGGRDHQQGSNTEGTARERERKTTRIDEKTVRQKNMERAWTKKEQTGRSNNSEQQSKAEDKGNLEITLSR